MPNPSQKRLRPSGGYRKLASFHTTTLIYDATVAFCKKHVSKFSRTNDQMVQAARASLEELLLDFEDYLRQNDHPLWPKDQPEAAKIRALSRQCRAQKQDPSNRSDPSDLTLPTDTGDRARSALYRPFIQHPDPASTANAILCLIHQANYLLDQHLIAMERAFVEGGGYRETLHTARIVQRKKDQTDPSNPTDPQKATAPNCPDCEHPMAIRTAKTGSKTGAQFWGCTAYPNCKKTLPV